jgi:hypothetical protein
VKSNSITSLGFTGTQSGISKDVTIYTKASIYRLNADGSTTGVDGNVTLRIDAHDGCPTTSCASSQPNPDTVGFTVLSSKDGTLFYSNNWQLDSSTKSWRTVQQAVTSSPAAIVIN